ncbi:D-alanyl-D-alanine carboxypeptidase family protein [Clostridium hydrogenum]|uniref:D-alanyl-D-alanine carboxypeptidase family protein n=1 Tax=Clostridium hydrogenum TaxID=2855764 RepID=UPI001F299EBE|nr:D-alanyl-D-alanine carboxypeptidase family protein [Clostridium hydrogenum]
MKRILKGIIGIFIIMFVWVLFSGNMGKAVQVFSSNGTKTFIETQESITEESKSSDTPSVSAIAALTLDVSSNKIIYAKNIHNRMYPASTTKLLTAQVFADNENKNSVITYTKDSKMQPANKLDLIVGEELKGDTAMKGMLIYSANDIAEAIGENVAGSIPAFAEKMNEKASSLGLKESHFANANGLPNENHYTTAYDLSKIAKNVYNYPWIMNILGEKSDDIKTRGKDIQLENTNKLLGIDGCIAGKTGYTAAAGRCLVAYYERNNKKMIGIVLGSANEETVDSDMEKIIDWSYSKL